MSAASGERGPVARPAAHKVQRAGQAPPLPPSAAGESGPPGVTVRAGVDLGGTGSRVVVCSGREVLAQQVMRTAELGAGSVEARVARLAAVVRDGTPPGARLAGVGIGSSGPIAPDWSEITNPDTMPWFSGFPLPAMLEHELGVPVRLDNDAVAAALGEYHHGAGTGASQLLAVTIGTGVGVSLLVAGIPFRAASGQHPDSGHLPVFGDGERCYCGLVGCLEQHASRLALERRLREAGAELALADLDAAPEAAQPLIATAFEAYGADLGRGLEALDVVYGPDRIVICGASSALFHRFEGAMRSAMARAPGYTSTVQVVPSALGDLAGALGAATLVGEEESWAWAAR